MKCEQLSARALKSLFSKSGNQCAFDGCNHVIVGPNGTIFGNVRKITEHETYSPDKIESETDVKRSVSEDLMLVCGDCIKHFDEKSNILSVDQLREMKKRHETENARISSPADGWIALQLLDQLKVAGSPRFFIVDAEGQVTERFLNSVLQTSTVQAVLHKSIIGDDQLACAYIAYLIRRYNEFASKEKPMPAQFNSKAISQNLETRYKSHWKQIPRVRFPHICRYLKHRIDRTNIAKQNGQKRLLSYRSYSEFLLTSRGRH